MERPPSWCCFLLLCYVLASFVAAENPSVTIKQGTLSGTIHKSLHGRDIHAFKGIPYAKPPLGELRFQAPIAADPWDGVWDASKNRSRCAQLRYPDLHYVGMENCLYINVYTSQLPSEGRPEELLPVLVYIHGGIFVHSSGDLEMYDPKLLMDEADLVFVTFNYRLGVLGFLSTEDAASPGNYGLKDQVLALQWVRDNIAAFAGDPGRVTLMGDNAGAISAHLHMLSPLSRGLFHGAISQSGTALTHWALNRDPLGRTQYLAELLECGDNSTSSHEIVSCLREIDAETLIKKSQRVLKWRTDWIVPFLPSVEAEGSLPREEMFLPDQPRQLLQTGQILNAVPWLVGVCSHDGLPHSLQLMLFSFIMADLNEDFEHYAPYYFELDGPLEHAKEAARLIRTFYFEDRAIGQGAQTELANMHTDYFYFTSLVKSAAYHVMADAPPVYIYHFSFQNRKSRLAIGVPQGDDTQYILPRDSIGRPTPEEGSDEMTVAKRLIHAVVNFLYHGEPLPDDDETFGVSWPPIDNKAMYFVDFNKRLSLNTSFYEERIAFWNGIDDILETGEGVLKDGPITAEVKDEL